MGAALDLLLDDQAVEGQDSAQSEGRGAS
jgi:hypothetical protein